MSVLCQLAKKCFTIALLLYSDYITLFLHSLSMKHFCNHIRLDMVVENKEYVLDRNTDYLLNEAIENY